MAKAKARGSDGGQAGVASGRTAAAVRSALPAALNDKSVSAGHQRSRVVDIHGALHEPN